MPRPDVIGHPARVLIVDDERHNRQLLEVMLRPEGYHLVSVASGEEALAAIAWQAPDLVLLDIMMPGMDGYEITAKIKSNAATTNIPVIMVTALADRDARIHGLSAGAEDFLSKPVDRAELCVRVRNLLRLKAYGDYHDSYSRRLEVEVGARTVDLIERAKLLEVQATALTQQAALLDLTQDAVVVRDLHGRILFWSRGAEVMYGWTSQEALGRHTRELLKTDYSEAAETIEAAFLRDGQWEGEATQYTRQGKRLTVASRWALQRDADGAPLRALNINTNITDRRRADAERHLLADRLSLATSVAKVGVWEWDLATGTLAWDATMFDIYGLTPAPAMPYERWSSEVHPDDLPALEATMRRAIYDKSQSGSEFRIILADGTVRWISTCESVVLDERQNVCRLTGVNMDVTERKEAERVLDQSRTAQIKFKDEFLSHVSHELRSPLTAIKQFTTILLGGLAGALNQEQREYQQIVLKNIRQLQAMIDDLLEVTRLETGKVTIEQESTSIADAVTDILGPLHLTATAKEVTLVGEVAPDLPPAYANQTRLRQILIILLDNAIKFSPGGSSVTVTARLLERDRRFVVVDVADSGPGISPNITERVFERLYQVTQPSQGSRKGLGLGLYICKELVTRQGGHIWVKSLPQHGSTFSFTLPVFSPHSTNVPHLHTDSWPPESVALVMVEICLTEPSPSGRSRDDWSREIRSLVQECLLPELDLLLPTMSSGAEGERFLFVVRAPAERARMVAAFVEDHGGSELADRVQKRFASLPHPEDTRLSVSVSYSMLEPFPPDAGEAMEHVVTSMASDLEASIKSQITSEAT